LVRRALILGSGGNAAFAWEIGVIAGMARAGVDVRNSELFVGTSAGARVGVRLASGDSPEDLFEAQIAPRPDTESLPEVNMQERRRAIAKTKEGR
jgi:NTE family protein